MGYDSALLLVIPILVLIAGNENSAKASWPGSSDYKIVGGYNVSIEQVPYQAYLAIYNRNDKLLHSCGGVIINTRYILTAAHCLVGATLVRVKIGSRTNTLEGNIYESSNIVTHPRFQLVPSDKADYDVGLIKLSRDMTLDGKSAKSATLAKADSDVSAGTMLLISGWGRTSEENENGSKYLLAVEIPSVSRSKCANLYQFKFPVTHRMICAGLPQGGHNACSGDSGGPAFSMKTKEVVGITSFTYNGCAAPGYPTIYTNIGAVRSWIDLYSKI